MPKLAHLPLNEIFCGKMNNTVLTVQIFKKIFRADQILQESHYRVRIVSIIANSPKTRIFFRKTNNMMAFMYLLPNFIV